MESSPAVTNYHSIPLSSSSSLTEQPTSVSPAFHPTPSSDVLMDHAPAISSPPTFQDQVHAILAASRTYSQWIASRPADIVLLTVILFHLAVVFSGLVVLAYDPQRKHTLATTLLPILVILSILLTHVYLLELVVRFNAFGLDAYKANAWNILDVLVVMWLLWAHWFLRLPECLLAAVVVGGRLWRMILLTHVDDMVKKDRFQNDMERLAFLGVSIKKEREKHIELAYEWKERANEKVQIKGMLEQTVNAALKKKP